MMPVSSTYRGFARNPVTLTNTFLGEADVYTTGDTFWERLKIVSDFLIDQVASGPIASEINENAGKLLKLQKPSTKQYFFKKAVITLNDYPNVFNSPSSKGSDLFSVGEYCSKTGPLKPKFSKFIDDPKSLGTIYVAFGSYVDLNDGPDGIVDIFVKALNHFEDYRVIWSYKGKTNCTKPHVMITKWAPQKDILSHPKTKIFFTHGGLKSAKEGVCSGVPMLFLPFLGDQSRNSQAFIKREIAEAIWKFNITSEEIVLKIGKILDDKKYTDNVKKMRDFYKDQVIDPLELGIFEVEKVLRSHESVYLKFKRRSIYLENWKYLNFDLIILPILFVYILTK